MKAVLLAVLLLLSFEVTSQDIEKLKLPFPAELERIEISPTSAIQWYKPEELLKLLPKFVAAEGTYASKQPFQRGKFILKNGKTINWMANYTDSILLYEDAKEQLYVLPKEDEPLFVIWDEKGKEGYIDANGKIVIKPQFDNAAGFSEGFAPVLIDGKWGYINRKGEIAIQPRWRQQEDWIAGGVGSFSEGLAAVTEFARWGVRDDSNYWTYKCGYINTKGEYVVQPKMRQSCLPFSGGAAIIAVDFEGDEYEKDKGWLGYMKPDGTWLVKPQFYTASYFHNGVARVSDETGKYFIDKTGKRVEKPVKDCLWTYSFHEGLALFYSEKEKRHDGFINENCEYAFRFPPEIKAENTHFSEGLAGVYKEIDGKKLYGFIDKTGKIAIPFKFAQVSIFSENLAGVAVDKKDKRTEAYINRKGEIVLNNMLSTGIFRNGLSFNHLHTWTISEQPDARNIYGYMNKQGKYVWLSPRAEVYLDKNWIKANYVGK